MRNTLTLLTLLAVVGMFCLPSISSAVGLGIYIPTVGSGTSTVKINDEDYEIDGVDNSHFGFGFVLDTKVANPGVFNYRLHIGYESFDLGNKGMVDLEDNFSRFSIDNTFGFAVLQSSVVRLWLGPQIRISYMGYSDDYNDINMIGFGFAPVLGANFNMGRVFTLAPELGYRFSIFAGTNSYSYEDFYGSYSEDTDFTVNGSEFYIKLNIIFRISDYYDNFF